MNFQPLILIFLLPFFGALISGLVALQGPKLCRGIVLYSLYISLFFAIITLLEVIGNQNLSYHLGAWRPPYGIEFTANIFNLTFIIFILIVAIVNLIHSNPILKKFYPRGPQFYTLYLLLVSSFIGMSLSGDVFNIYVFLEISSLTSYALIGRGDARAAKSALNYLFLGTIGASFYLIGVGYLYIKTGTLNIGHLSTILPGLYFSTTVKTSFIFIVVGLMFKMAAFPLHTWLPNAYSYCPQPTVGLIAPLATKVALFLLFKISFEVFGIENLISNYNYSDILVNLSAIGIIIVCFLAVAQKNLLRSFCYIVIAEIGYIFGGFWLLNKTGLIGASYHIFCDIILTLALFLFIGSIKSRYKSFEINVIKNIIIEMPVLTIAFLISCLSLIGLPPTGGFISKLYLLQGAYQANQFLFFGSLIFASIS